MADNTIGWGQGSVNNTNDWGKGKANSTNDWGSIYANSPSGDTNIEGGGAVATGLLADYPNASGAYSLRNLISTNTNVVRVRRSSDNAEQDFSATEITDGTLTTFTGANDGFVTTWYDQSGNNKNATQTTALDQPKLVSNGVVETENGLPTINSVSQYLTMLTPALTSDLEATIIGVYRNTSSNILYSYRDSSNDLIQISVGGGKHNFQIRSSSTSIVQLQHSIFTISGQLLHFAKMNRNTNNHIYAINSTNIVTDTTVINGTISSTEENISAYYTGVITKLNGKFQELIIYSSDKSSDRSGIETNINNHYNIYTEIDTNTLIAYYNFNNNVLDQKNSYDGTWNGTSAYATGKSGQAISNNGNTSNYISIADADAFSFTNGTSDIPFSISFYHYSNSSSDQMLINKMGASSNREWYINSFSNQIKVRLYNSDGGTTNFIGKDFTHTRNNNTWYHYVLTYDGSETSSGLKMYVDGVLTFGSQNDGGTYTGMANLVQETVIGRFNDLTLLPLDGLIDGMGIWDKELSAGEVTQIYNTQNSGSEVI